MCTAILTGISAVGSVMQGAAQKKSADARAAAAEQNARIAENAATDAVKRGGAEELQMRRRMAGLLGKQKAAAAAAGADLDSGSVVDAALSSMNEAERDIAINDANTQREAYGYQAEAVNYRNTASAERASGKNALTSGFINAGTSLVSLAAPTVDTIGNGGIKVKAGSVQLGPDRGPFDALNAASALPAYWRK